MNSPKELSTTKVALLILLSTIVFAYIVSIDEYVLGEQSADFSFIELLIPFLLIGIWLGIRHGRLIASDVRRNAIYLYLIIVFVIFGLFFLLGGMFAFINPFSELFLLSAAYGDFLVAGIAVFLVSYLVIFPIISYLVIKLGEYVGYKIIRNMKIFYVLLATIVVFANINLFVKPQSVGELLEGEDIASKSSEVIEKLMTDCSSNNVSSCKKLGWIYKNSSEETQDINEVISLFQKACDGGDASACNDLGWIYKNGSGIEASTELATNAFKSACDLDSPEGCKNLGVIYSLAEYNASDSEDFLSSLYHTACKDEQAESCLLFKKAVSLYETACDNGKGQSCTRLGLSYGVKGGSDNLEMAVKLFEKACENGDGMGCLYFANFYKSGDVVEKNIELAAELDKKAVSLFQVACDGDDLGACTGLGISYGYGLGVEEDFSKSLAVLKKACAGGEAKGCFRLGVMYDEVIGADRNLKYALMFFKQACENGNADGCNSLGLKYRFGYGVERDMGKAQSLFMQACDDGAFGGNMSRDYGCYFDRPRGLEVPFELRQITPVLPHN